MSDDRARTSATVEELRQLVAEQVEASSGKLINFVGDNFMALFEDALHGIQAAIAITDAVYDRNADLPPSRRVEFRMGLDQGEVSEVNGTYFGDPLNIAARIQAKAKPGGISVSARVYRALDEPSLRFRTTGTHRLKNIPEPVEIFEYDLGHGRTHGLVSKVVFDLPTLIILPVIAEGVSGRVKATAEVFRSDLIHRLSELDHVKVIENMAGDSFDGGPAHYIVEIGVVEIGDSVRIYAKLTEVATMNVATSLKWVTTMDGFLDLIESMVDDFERRVEIELVVGDRAALYDTVENPEVSRKMFQGWYHLMVPNKIDWRQAIQLFNEIVEEVPDSIYGRVMQAFGNWLGAAEGFASNPEELLDLAFEQASDLEKLEDPTGMASMVKAAVYLSRNQPEAALATIENVQITRPTCDLTFALEGSIRRYLGQWQQSVDLINTAIDLAAVTPPWYPTVQACSLFLGERLDRAGQLSAEVVEHYPDTIEALLILAAVQAEMGLERRARATVDEIKERFPAFDFDRWLEAHPYRDPGVVERWRRDLAAVGLGDDR